MAASASNIRRACSSFESPPEELPEGQAAAPDSSMASSAGWGFAAPLLRAAHRQTSTAAMAFAVPLAPWA
eukprot:15077855-Alexandrium_andersonii.AAC.1